MFCKKCGGVIIIIAIEEYPEHLTNLEKLHYNRVCDVKCSTCGNVRYSQPYDDGPRLNLVRNTKPLK